MRAWIEELDDDHDVYFHAVDKSQIQAVADSCAALRDAGMTGKEDKLVMSCDGFTIMEWCNRHGITWDQFFRDSEITNRFLDDPANAPFRIWKGRV